MWSSWSLSLLFTSLGACSKLSRRKRAVDKEGLMVWFLWCNRSLVTCNHTSGVGSSQLLNHKNFFEGFTCIWKTGGSLLTNLRPSHHYISLTRSISIVCVHRTWVWSQWEWMENYKAFWWWEILQFLSLPLILSLLWLLCGMTAAARLLEQPRGRGEPHWS